MPDTTTSPATAGQPADRWWAKLTPWANTDETASADGYDRYPRWPVVLLAAGAFVAIWGGWVDLGRMAGFGPVNLLPGIADLYVDLAITLPLGMEVYAAFALGVLLTHRNIRPKARKFAGISVVFSLIIGASGQVAYHLLSAAGIERAPWQVVVVVACVPVAVMGMGAALSHLLAPVPTNRRRPAVVVDQAEVASDGMSPNELEAEDSRAKIEDSPRPALETVAREPEPVSQAVEPQDHDEDNDEQDEQDDPNETDLDRAERDQRILDLARSGQVSSERELAALVPCSRSTVNRVLRRYGVTLNRQDEPALAGAGQSA